MPTKQLTPEAQAATMMTAWDNVIADLERRRDELTKAIEAVKNCRQLAERIEPPVCEIDFSRAPILRQLLS